MEHLIIDLKERLIARRQKETLSIEKLNKENDKELILFSAGKIDELDFVLKSINEMLKYSERNKRLSLWGKTCQCRYRPDKNCSARCIVVECQSDGNSQAFQLACTSGLARTYR